MKNSIKIFILSIFTFLVGITIADAKQLTYEQLQKEIEKINPYAVEARIIGKYVFTDANPLTDQDIMAGAVSIDGIDDKDYSEELYNKLTINRLVREINTSTGDYENWGIVGNLVGKTTISSSSTFDIRWIDKKFIPEVSKTNINVDVDNEKYSTYKNILETKLNFKTEDFYGTYDGAKKLKIDGNKISGLLLKKSVNDLYFNDEDKAKYKDVEYYFAYILEVPNADENVTVNIKGLNGETKTATWQEFDVQTGTPGIVILVPVDRTKWETNKEITIIVDVDGDDNKNYEPTEYKLDLSGLKFQDESEADLKTENLPEADVKSISDNWGYTKGELDTYKLESKEGEVNKYKLTGVITEQEIKDNVFPQDEKTGFYFLLSVGQNIDSNLYNKATVTYPGNKGTKTSTITDETGLTILFSTSDANKSKPIKITVDLDGNGDEYYPVEYEIDLSGLTLEKSSLFTVVAIDDINKSQYDDDAWYNETDGYSVKVVKDDKDSNKYKVSGVLPILEDEDWKNNDAPFEDNGSLLYYLGLGLKLTNAPKDYNDKQEEMKLSVLFDHDAESNNFKKLFGSDFDTSSTVYILKALKATTEDNEKWFTITVDLDGDDKEEYAPYTVTIDYSDLEFQDESKGNIDFDVFKKENLEEDSAVKKELDGYGFNSETVADVSIKTEQNGGEDREPSKVGIQGSIKEQTLTNGFNNNTGYFVPIKISVPIDEPWFTKHQNEWTIILNTEDGKKKTYIPTTEEHKQGWIMVLFRLDNNDNKEIKYEIDFDGDGDAFLPFEYTIKYDELEFKALDKITYNYRDNNGQSITETASVYQNEEITLKDLSDIVTDYRTFEGWYKEDGTKVEGSTLKITEDKDEILTAHWNLNAEKFVEDVLKDLNDDDTTHSAKFNDKFVLEQEENNITVDIKQPNVLLSELSKTSIPGAMAYVLEKGEIEDITLTVGESNTKTFTKDGGETLDTLKQEIIDEAKKLFDTELTNNEETATLDKVEFIDKDDKIFTIKIGDTVNDTVTLVKSDGTKVTTDEDKTYTFKFDSDFVVVDQDGTIGAKDIENALNDTKDYSTVYIDGKYEAENTINITASNDVTITPVESASSINLVSAEDKTISTKAGDYVIDVQEGAGTVTISNLELTSGEKAELKVENGATVTVDNIKLSKNDKKNLEEGIYVDETGTLTATNITFEDETHDVPAVRGKNNKESKKNAKVTFKNSTIQEKPFYNIEKHDNLWCKDEGKGADDLEECETSTYDDYYEYTTDTFYYSKSENKKDYILVGFMNNYKFHGFMYKIVENGSTGELKPAELSSEDKTGSNTKLHFVGWGTTNSSTINYSNIITDWSKIKVTNQSAGNKFYYAYYVEYNKTITVDINDRFDTGGIDKYDNKEYHTYKLADKTEGMTIGELKKIDSDFAQMLKDLEENKGPNKIMIDEQEVTDDTKISENVILTLSSVAEMG